MVRKMKRDNSDIEETNKWTQENKPASNHRTIRSYYRQIECRISEGKDDLANADSDKFMAIMNEVENMHQHVEKPREQVADAEILLGLTNTLAASVRTHTIGGLTPAEFVSCLIREFDNKRSMKTPNFSWQSVGLFVSPIFMNGTRCMTMIGPMENTVKQRKLAVRAKRSSEMGKARPKELDEAGETVTDTDRNLQVMFEILKKEKKVKAEDLILNRSSFAQTVENLFALSFLVKDGRVRYDVDESGRQVVVPTNGPSAEEIKTGVVKNHQFVFRFDFNDWKLMNSTVREGEELMPRREALANAGSVEAEPEPCDHKFSPPDDSHFILTTPVKKFSKNYGRTTQSSCVSEIYDGTFENRNYKRKRSIV